MTSLKEVHAAFWRVLTECRVDRFFPKGIRWEHKKMNQKSKYKIIRNTHTHAFSKIKINCKKKSKNYVLEMKVENEEKQN